MSTSLITPLSFRESAPPTRIAGFETEYDLREKASGGYDHEAAETLIALSTFEAAGIIAVGSGGRAWTQNGSVVYLDADRHNPTTENVEYATPECFGIAQAVAAERTGPILLNKLLQVSGLPPHTLLRRGITFDLETAESYTKGFHGSLIVPKELISEERLGVLETHLVTQVFGGGVVTGLGFNIAPKALGIGRGIVSRKSDTSLERQKPLVLLCPPNADERDVNIAYFGFGRFEDRSKTPGTPWGDFMGLATTSLLLRVLEHPELVQENKALRALAMINPVQNFRNNISWDMSFRRKYEMIDGRQLTVVEIQKELALIAKSASEKLKLPREEVFAVQEWLQICDDLQLIQEGRAPLDLVADRLGWASKYVYLSKKIGAAAVQSGTFEAMRYCLNWDIAGPQGAAELYAQKYGRDIFAIGGVRPKDLLLRPPKHTRAEQRAASIVKNRALNTGLVSWSCIPNPREHGAAMKYLHPYNNLVAEQALASLVERDKHSNPIADQNFWS